jgi:hypothetical protein
MSHKSITKKYIEVAPNEEGVTHLKVETYYSIGGMNYFNGTNEPRGIYLSVSPVTRSCHEGKYWSESFKGFSGNKKHMFAMERYNKKKCETFVVDAEYEQTLIDYVLNKNKLQTILVIS